MKIWVVYDALEVEPDRFFSSKDRAREWVDAWLRSQSSAVYRVAADEPWSDNGSLRHCWGVIERSLDPLLPAPWREPIEPVLGEN